MTRATLLLLLAALAITATMPLHPSQSLTAGRTPPNASTRPLDGSDAFTGGAIGGGGAFPAAGPSEDPSPAVRSLSLASGQEAGDTTGGAGDRLPSSAPPDHAALDLASFALATPLVGFGGLHPIAESWSRGVASGIASWMGEGYGSGYLALPIGPGFRVRLCGAAGCAEMTSNDSGPDLAMQRRGRVADVAVVVWERITGLSRRLGLAQISVAITGRVRP